MHGSYSGPWEGEMGQDPVKANMYGGQGIL
jgi:hypothetical protein